MVSSPVRDGSNELIHRYHIHRLRQSLDIKKLIKRRFVVFTMFIVVEKIENHHRGHD